MSTKDSITRFSLIAMAVAAIPAMQAMAEEPAGIRVGAAHISPFLNFSYLYDSNPNNANDHHKDQLEQYGEKVEKSSGFTVQPGINITLPGNDWKLVGNAYYLLDHYCEGTEDNHKDWGESLTFSAETDGGLRLKIYEQVRQAQYEEELDALEDSESDRLLQNYSFSLAKSLTDKSDIELSGTYSDTDYDDDDLFDSKSYGGSLGFSLKMTEKSDAFIRSSYIVHESQDESSKAKSIRGIVGFRSRATEKVVYDVGVGIEHYENFEDDFGDSDSENGFYYDANISWKVTPRLVLSLVGDSNYQPAEDVGSNSEQTYSIGVNADYRPFERWKFAAGVSYRLEDYTLRLSKDMADRYYADENGANSKDRKDDGFSTFVRAVYGICEYASIFADARYTDVSSSIDDFDYDRYRVSIGMALRF